MKQVQTQNQSQTQEQRLRMSLQQLQMVELLGLSIGEFEERVKKELVENDALGEGSFQNDDEMDANSANSTDEMEKNDTGDDPYSDAEESEILSDSSKYDSDDLPIYTSGSTTEERNDLPIGDSESFIEYLESQMMNYDLDETQQEVMRYLIGLLNNHGFIDLPLHTIVDELAFNKYIYVDEEYVEDVLKTLQNFDPAGIGARDTQQCLLIQLDRQLDEDTPITELQERFLNLQRTVIADHYDLFIKQNKAALKEKLHLSDIAVKAIFEELKKLNVNPGLSLGEAVTSRVETQIPDFIVETDPEGGISLRLNGGDIPRLHVRKYYLEHMKTLQASEVKISKKRKEELEYTKERVEAAQMFIESVKQRRKMLYDTMKAIINIQRKFILSRDENDKVRMVQEDVADKVGCDISTVSRVCNSKCCLLDGRIYKLSDFFKLTRKNAEGEDVDSTQVGLHLKAIVDSEDKNKPYSDSQLVEILEKKGIKLARRTVAKYRTKLGIPSVNDRKL